MPISPALLMVRVWSPIFHREEDGLSLGRLHPSDYRLSCSPSLSPLGLIACKFRLSGQTCVCCNRIYLHKDIYEEFTALLVKKGTSRLSSL